MKKSLAILMSLLLLIGLIAGCGADTTTETTPQSDDEDTNGETTTQVESEDPEDEDPIEFSYLRPVWGPATYESGSDYEQELFTRANVRIDVQIVPVIDYESVFPTMVAGGNMPDVMWHAGPQWGIANDLIEQNAFLPLNDYLDQYPDVKMAISDYLWDMTRSSDGNNYFFPMPLSPFVPFPIYYRVDVFDDLGIDVPTTLDDFVDTLIIIRDNTDLIPLSAHEYTLWYFKEMATLFGDNFAWIPDPDDSSRIIPSNTTIKHRNFLEWMQMLRREELIDPDYMIATGMLGVDKFTAGNVATMVGHWGGYPDWRAELLLTEPDAEVGFIYDLQGPDRSMGAMGLSGFDRGFSIASTSEDKADDIFRFLNWVYTEGYDFMVHGVEGEMYTVNEDGDKISIPDDDRSSGFKRPNVEPFGFPLKADDVIPNQGQDWRDFYNNYDSRGIADRVDTVRDMFEYLAENAFPNYNRLTFSETQAEKGSQLYEQYIRPMQEQIAIDPDAPMSLFDTAVENWLNGGGADIIAEVNASQSDISRPDISYEYVGDDYR